MRKFWFTVFALLIPASSLLSQAGTAGSFLRLGVGAQAKAMGDAYTAIAAGVEASYYNPAGLPFLDKREVFLSYRPLSLGRSFSVVGFGMPVKPKVEGGSGKVVKGGIAFTWIRAGVGDIDGRNSDGGATGDFSNSENAFVFSFALNPVEPVALGLSVKVLWNKFSDIGSANESVSTTGVGFDFGAYFRPRDWLSFGLVLKDFNSRYRWNTNDLYGDDDGAETPNKLPRTVRIGTAVRIPQLKDIVVALDFENFYESSFFSSKLGDRIHVGVQGDIADRVAVRAGYDDGHVTAGAGYLFGSKSQLMYAFRAPGNRPEEEHVFSWIFRF